MKNNNKRIALLTVLYSGIRRRFLVYFRSRYVIGSLLRRKGKCHARGRCCLLNKPWCRYFEEGRCRIYQRQPFFCKVYPVDEKDREMSGVSGECGYWWDKDDKS